MNYVNTYGGLESPLPPLMYILNVVEFSLLYCRTLSCYIGPGAMVLLIELISEDNACKMLALQLKRSSESMMMAMATVILS